jgi:hypothetical protein
MTETKRERVASMSRILSNTYDYAKAYDGLGWSLVAIPAGSKGPNTANWQKKATPPDHWISNPTHNIGLMHLHSKTVALDIDHMANTRLIFEAMNIDFDGLLSSAPRIIGRPERGKALFRAPDGIDLTRRALSWPSTSFLGKSEVVFELRAGSVQDVLPPSIHPDTGNPYKWAGASIWDGLPELPAQVLMIWREWDRFRPQMIDLCPWKPAPEFVPPRKPRAPSERASVIDAYNAAYPITDALGKAGYRLYGNRWLSPNSTSKIPGVVVFDDGRAYSHHASDPFDSAHSFDAFDVFCYYEHFGNVTNAVRAAADLLHLENLPQRPSAEDREMILHGASVARQIMAKPKEIVEAGLPRHLLTVPGVLGDLVAYSAKTAIKYQPQFDVQTALALGSVAMGRRFVTDNNNMTSLYFLNVGKTGSGKEHANTVIENALEAAGAIHLRGPNGYTSASAVLSALKDKPAHITVIDEFGSMLESASAKGNQHKKDALTAMMEAWGRQIKTMRNLGYSMASATDAQKKAMQIEVKSPSLTMIGMTTPETFYQAIGSIDVASGFLNRLLIVESKRPRELSRNPKRIDVPLSVVNWIKAVSTAEGEGGSLVTDQGAEFPPVPVLVPFTQGARALFRSYEQAIIDRQNASHSIIADMMNRSLEMAMRLSLIVAVSLSDDDISETSAQWSIDYVDFYLQQTIAMMDQNMSEGENDKLRKMIADAVMKSGSVGMTMAELLKAVPRIGNQKKHDRDQLLATVIEDYPIERMVVKPANGKGRPSIIHRVIQPADDSA